MGPPSVALRGQLRHRIVVAAVVVVVVVVELVDDLGVGGRRWFVGVETRRFPVRANLTYFQLLRRFKI